jgi:hypothetical protein
MGEIERVLGTPLAELIDSEQDHAHAHELTHQVSAAAAIVDSGSWSRLSALDGARRTLGS